MLLRISQFFSLEISINYKTYILNHKIEQKCPETTKGVMKSAVYELWQRSSLKKDAFSFMKEIYVCIYVIISKILS